MQDGQGAAVVDVVEGGQFDGKAVGCPVLRHADADDAGQRLVGGPHQVLRPVRAAPVGEIVGQVFQGAHDAFSVGILDESVDRVGQVLFADMDEGVDQTVFELAVGQAGHHLRVEDGEARPGRLGIEGFFLLRCLVGDDRAGI